jgi:hypothetical protein
VDNRAGAAENARIASGVRAVKALGSSAGRVAMPVVVRPVAIREPGPDAPVARLPGPVARRRGAIGPKAPRRRS